jgi:hypothetical protein
VCDGPPIASSAAQHRCPHGDPVNDHEPDNRAGWSFLGFMRSVLRDGPSFWRLFALVLLLIFGYALAKGDVTALYEHLTLHATVWEKWGIPPGSVGIVFGARRYFIYRRATQERRAAAEEERRAAAAKERRAAAAKERRAAAAKEPQKELPRDGAAAKPDPEKASDQNHYLVGEPARNHGENGGHADPDLGPRPASEV